MMARSQSHSFLLFSSEEKWRIDLLQDVCEAVDKSPDLIFGPPVEGYRLAGAPVQHVITNNERTCQYVCKVQSVQTGCDAYNFRDTTENGGHDCELFNITSFEGVEQQSGTHFRFLQKICDSSPCLCNPTYCGVGERRCMTQKPGTPFKCFSCANPSEWIEGSLVEKYCLTFGWYKVGTALFKPVRQSKTWGEARKYCQVLDADLASITSEEQTKFIEEHLFPLTDDIQYVMANNAESCTDACSRGKRECVATRHLFPKDGKGVLDIFKSLGISCRAGSVSTNYHFEDNPGYFTQGNNAGECIGYDRIPDVIDCDVGSNVKLRRLCPCLKVDDMDLIGHWKLDGTDPDVTLKGSANYQTVDGRKSLHLNGQPRTFAEVPSFDLPPDLTIACWVRVYQPSKHNVIFSDWSNPWRFRLFLGYETADPIEFVIRNPSEKDLIYHYGPSVTAYRRQWMHLAITLKKSTKTTRIYINSVLKSTHTSTNNHTNTYMVNNHKVFDIGLKRDSINDKQFHGHLQDLAVFGRVLTQEEIAQISQGNFVVPGVWLGLNDLDAEGTFRWSDGSAVTLTKWERLKPNAKHKLQDCVKVQWKTEWNDVSCGQQLYFVCKKN